MGPMHDDTRASAHRTAAAPWERLARGAGVLDEQGQVSTTIFETMSALAARHRAINLGQGFPDTEGPKILAASLARAVGEGCNQYAPMAGLPRLQEAIADHEEQAGRRRPDPAAEVTVTAGATEGLAGTMMAFLSPGDEVVLFEPFYDLYAAVAGLAGASVRTVPMLPPHFRPDPQALQEAFGPRTAMVILNDPHNPSGAVFEPETLEQIARLAVQQDALILTDSVYEHLWFGRSPGDIAACPGASERTIRISAASKTFHVTGWRVGWAIAPPELTKGLRITKGYFSHSAAAPLQHAIADTLEWAGSGGYYEDWQQRYAAQKDLLVTGLRETAALEPVDPEGTFFALARLTQAPTWASDGRTLAEALPERAGVGLLPLETFTTAEHAHLYRDWVRLTFCKKPETLAEAIRRLHQAGL